MSLFGNLFNSNKQSQNSVNAVPIRSLSQVPGGKEYFQTIQDRIAGRGTGYGADYTSFANPQIANLKNNFESYQLPELKSELTATGRRAGSSGFQQIAKAYQEEGLNENSILGNLMQRNAEASHTDVNNAINAEGAYAQNEANMSNAGAQFDYNNTNQQLDNEKARLANQSKGYQQIGQGITDAAMNFAVPGAASFMGAGNSGSGGYGSTFNSGGQYWKPSAPPANYNYSNIGARLAQRNGQMGSIA